MLASFDEFSAWLVGSMRCGIVAIDARAKLVFANDDARRILALGAGPEVVVGACCRDVLGHQPEVLALLLGALEGRERATRAECALSSPAGRRELTIGYTLSAVRDPVGQIRGGALFFRDLTPIERRDEQERLRGRLAALGEMAAGLAHEIRNPLAGMQVLAGLLERRMAPDPECLPLVEGMLGEIQRVERVVGQTLDFVRPAGPVREPVDLVRLVEASLSRAVARVGFEPVVERHYPEAPQLPPLVGDPVQLEAAFGNLLENALEAMAETPAGEAEHCLTVSVSVEKSDGLEEVVISVTDSGPGVPSELCERVFYPFFTTKDGGSGVGLSAAQKIVASHGGVLSVDVAPAGGACFHVHLPVDGGGS